MKSLSKIIFLIFLALLLFATVNSTQLTTLFKGKAAAPVTINSPEMTVNQLTEQILSQNKSLLNLENKEDSVDINNKITQLTNRKKLMLSLMEKDINSFMTMAIPDKVTKNFGPKVTELLEKEIKVPGKLEYAAIDDFQNKKFREEYHLYTEDNKKIRLFFVDKHPDQNLFGKKIEVVGYELDNNIAVTSFSPLEVVTNTSIKSLSLPQSSTPVEKRVAVVLFNFLDNPSQPWTVEQVKSWTFTDPKSVAAYYSEVSNGKLHLTGDVFGWLTTDITAGTGCPDRTAAVDAKNKLLSQGVDISTYNYIIYAFPKISCGYSGMVYNLGNEAWINENYNQSTAIVPVSTVIHEFGHMLGLSHANSHECYTTAGVRTSFGPSFQCDSNEYGDPFDVMGNVGNSRHLSAFYKGKVNFLYPGNMVEVATSGQYVIYPAENDLPTNIQSLRIPVGTDYQTGLTNYYYLEYRRPYGIFDTFDSADPVVNGISIRLGSNYSDLHDVSNLIDTTSSTTTFNDAALGVGKTFNDTYHGVRIKTISVSSDSVTADILKYSPPCTRSIPKVVLNPSTAYGLRGEKVQHALTIGNSDTPTCGPSTFTVIPTLPTTGWTQNPTKLTVVLNPGESSQLYFTIQSPIQSPLGYFTVKESIRHGGNSQFSTSTNNNFVVYSNKLSTIEFISPVNGQTLKYGNRTLTIKVIDENGISDVSIFNNNNWIGSASLTTTPNIYKLSSYFNEGNHVIKVEVYNLAGNHTDKSITVHFIRLSPTPTPAPVVASFKSVDSYDGWVLESSETSGAGGSVNTTKKTISIGDSASNQQYKGILHFNTGSIPDSAVIKSAILKLKSPGSSGTNPLNTTSTPLGLLKIDISRQFFGTSAQLTTDDFSAPPLSGGVGTVSRSKNSDGFYTSKLSSSNTINKAGTTQLRLYFTVDDNNNSKADYIDFYSGSTLNDATVRPVLVVTYTQ